jgi:hypothetical protein
MKLKLFLLNLIFIVLSNSLQSNTEMPFTFKSEVKCKKPNGNPNDKDKVKINFEITPNFADYQNVLIKPETTNGSIDYNGNGERIIDLFNGITFKD